MALNDFYNAETLAATALALVGSDLNLSGTVSRSYEANFVGGVGYSVNAKRPQSLKGRSRSIGVQTAITTDTLTEAVSTVTLTSEIYSAVDLTDADLTLNLEDFGAQVLKPQTDAIVYDAEALVSTGLAAVTPTIDLPATVTFDSLKSAASAARKTFRENNIPADGNWYAVMGTESFAAYLDGQNWTSVGSNDAITSGQGLPSLYGFRVIENNVIDPDRVVFYHRDAFHLALRAPVVPQGVTFGASVSGNGFAIRAIRDYDATTLQDRSVLSVFSGFQTLGVVKRDKTTGATSVYVPAIAADKAVA
jgi:hypothetical protein